MELNEIDREEILAQRLEEMQRLQDKRSLDQMLREQRGEAGDPDAVANAAKRTFQPSMLCESVSLNVCLVGQHAVRGATREKSRKLDELKARRKAKDTKKTVRARVFLFHVLSLTCLQPKSEDSPKRERSSSPTDMEMSSEEEEDGQISKLEEEEERDRKLYGKPQDEEGPIVLDDLLKCLLTRDKIARACLTPWFEDYVKGEYLCMWVCLI